MATQIKFSTILRMAIALGVIYTTACKVKKSAEKTTANPPAGVVMQAPKDSIPPTPEGRIVSPLDPMTPPTDMAPVAPVDATTPANPASPTAPKTIAPPELSKTAIFTSGCSAYLPEGMGNFDLAFSEDSSEVYTSQTTIDSFSYGCIAVKFIVPLEESETEKILTQYMDYLKKQFQIVQSAGYGKGHKLESNAQAKGIVDYWTNDAAVQYKIKGWVTPTHIGILYLSRYNEYPWYNAQEMYLNGFRFP